MFMSRKNLLSALAFICFFTVTGVWIQFKSLFSHRTYIFKNVAWSIKAETRPYLLDSYDDTVDESVTGLAYLRHNAGTWRKKATVFQHPRQQNRMMTIGIPTIQRENQTYIFDTLESLFNCSTKRQRKDIYIVVLLADFNVTWKEAMSRTLNQLYPEPIRTGLLQVIEAPADFYPPLTNLEHTYHHHSKEKRKWRAKQNFDYAFLFMYSKPLSTYYMQLEDDVYTVPGYLTRIRNHLLENDEWVCLEFSELGYIGKVYHSVDLEKLARMILLFYVEQPGDFTYLHFNSLMLQFQRKIVRPTLFQHAGYQSSLYGKIQKLQDQFFNFTPKVFEVENPPARLYTTIQKVNPMYPLFMAYDILGGYFWTKCKPRYNDTITIIFDTPQTIDQIIILTGSDKYPKDVIHSGRLEASLGLIKANNDTVQAKCIKHVLLGNFNGDSMTNITDVSKTLDSRQVNCLRITITRNGIRWLIIREIAVFTPGQSSTRKMDASFPTLSKKP